MDSNKLIWEEKNRRIIKEKELTTVRNAFFDDIEESVDIKKDDDSSLNSIKYRKINDALQKSRKHPGVHKIRQMLMTDKKFSFGFVTKDVVRKEIVNLDGSKATLNGDIFVNILKSTFDIHLLYKFVNRKRSFF